MNCRFMIQFSQTPIFYYWYCSVHSVEFFSTASLNRDAGLERDAALIAMRCFGARRGAPRRYQRHRAMAVYPRRNANHYPAPRRPPVGAGSSRFLAKIPPPTNPTR